MLVWVYTCQKATVLEITYVYGSTVLAQLYFSVHNFESDIDPDKDVCVKFWLFSYPLI